MGIRVALVEDNEEIREGLAALIDGSPGFTCVAAYADGESAVQTLPALHPDVVLMDLHLPGMSGIDCVKRLKEKDPALQIMMLTVYQDDDLVFRSLVAGACGYLLKKTPPPELLEAIRDLQKGGSPMSDTIARKVVEAFQKMGRGSAEAEMLSRREQEILEYLARGFFDKEIAEKLFLSVETVRTHLRSIYRKLHVRSRTEAVLKYLNH